MTLNQLHKPVLLKEVQNAFLEHFTTDQKLCGVDGTFGRGGHAQTLLETFKNLHLIAIDQDQEAISYAQKNFKTYIDQGRLRLIHANFSDSERIDSQLNDGIDFVFLDIGVSSPQLDDEHRGFSFYNDGPLDMRMDQTSKKTAADVINTYSLEDLREIFLKYGEVYAPDKLLNAIKEFRSNKNFETTKELSDLIESKLGWRKKGVHPATLYFQALRIYINQELESLGLALSYYVEKLKPTGIFVVISFHSLEDRMVKQFFKTSPHGRPVNKKVIKPTEDEIQQNKRARSSKLRVFKKEGKI